ncbi:MAG: PKD domain-containing protein [Bacteroidales bacterium]|nr:PKD domain-containing protein [Bacteroidales bacterium]HQP03913.1 PKD domain-containing protein [Bacteroidales bacterium]
MKKIILVPLVLIIALVNPVIAQTYLISSGGTVNTCSGTFYDSGGAGGQYGNSQNYTMTICSNLPGAHIVVHFTSFQLESNFDYLSIYNGPTTGSPVLVNNGSGTTLNGNTYTSTGTCLTFRFTSDGSVTYSGWSATISCSFPCQDYSVAITSTNPPVSNADSLFVDICQGDVASFTAQGSYPNSGVNYTQSDATTEFVWMVVDGSTTTEYPGVGMTTFTHTFTQAGGYFVNLVTYDPVDCTATLVDQYRVRVSLTPNFENVGSDVSIICPGDPVNLTGTVTSNTWTMPVTETQIVQECFYDNYEGTVCFTVSAFQPGQVITSMYDLESVCFNMEHSFIGDFYMYIVCPNGQEAMLHEYYNCNGAYFGIPDQSDNCNPGTGYTYCWSMSASQPVTSICSSGSTVPAGTYLPLGTFEDLIGCPINGDWCVRFFDNWGADDGTIFYADLDFADNIIPNTLWAITNTFNVSPTSTDLVWSGDGVEPNTGGNALAHPTTPGDQPFTFTVTDEYGCEYDTTIYVTVRQPNDPMCCVMPDPDAGPDELVCTNTYTFNPTVTVGNTYNWTMVSGPGTAVWTNQTSANASVTVSEYGVYVFQITEQNLSPTCSVSDQVEISLWPVPTSTFAASAVLCEGEISTITYTGSATAAASFTWDFAGGTVSSGSGIGPFHVTWSTAGAHLMSLQVTEHTCSSVVTTLSISTPALLDANPTFTDDPCYHSCNGEATLNVIGGTPPYEFSWASSTNYQNHLCAGDYVVSVTDVNECEDVVNFTIAEPTELIITDTSFSNISCYQADDGEMHITVSGGVLPYTYVWSDFGPGVPDRTNVPAGNYYVTVYDSNGCNVVEFYQLTQPAQLQVTIPNSMSICEGQAITLTAQAMGGTMPYTYYWNSGGGFSEGAGTLELTPLTTTTYTVSVVDAHNCESNTVSMTITVSPHLEITEVLLQQNRCFHSCDGSAELVIIGGIPPLNYSWGSTNHIYNNLCAGIYTVTVSDQIGCFATTYFLITEPDTLTYSINTVDASCYGSEDGTANIIVAGGTLPYSFLWPNNATTSFITTGAGDFVVTVTDAHSCRIEASYTVGQPTELVVQPAGNPQICIGQEATVSAQAAGGTPYYDFHWTGSDGTTYPTHLFHVSPDTTTIYTVTVVDSHGCLGNVATVTVNVYPPVEIESVTTSYDTVCQGERAIIYVNVIGGNGGPYIINLENGATVGSPFTVFPGFTSTYHVTASDMCGSPSASDSITITVMPFPEVSFTADHVNGCSPAVVHFTSLGNDENYSYLWDFGDYNFADIQNPMHIYNSAGTYDVSLIVTSPYGCQTSSVTNDLITVHPTPTASFYLEPEIATLLESEVVFTNLSQDAMRYFWYFGDGDSSLFVHPRHQYADVGEFEVYLVAESEFGCRDTVMRRVYVENIITFYAPETFTPNGDGINDCFRVCGNGIDPNHFALSVYDRWGECVFSTEFYDTEVSCDACSSGSWDGTDNGNRLAGDKYLPMGLYTWYCEFKDVNNITYKKSGKIRLIR